MEAIVIIDESEFHKNNLKLLLEQSGYTNVLLYNSFYEALNNLLGTNRELFSEVRSALNPLSACRFKSNFWNILQIKGK